MLGIDFPDLNTAEWAQVVSAAFTALAALAAWATVFRIGRDRRRSSWPELHVEVVVDVPGKEVRLSVLNLGGAAREVSIWGIVADFGFGGSTEPSTYWQPGERRTFRLHVPPLAGVEARVFVVGRDMAKRYIFVTTFGGATYRWRWRFRRLSTEKIWKRLFPGTPNPTEVKHAPMRVEVIEREVVGMPFGRLNA